MIKLLCIGNSFSQDATRYLYQIAQADGQDMKIFNLYIGGCSLSRHFRVMRSAAADYELQFNGVSTGLPIATKTALAADDWDFVTLQQASPLSTRYDTYQPYLNDLAAYVRSFVPKARLLIHQTWAYEQGSQRLEAELGYADQADMYRDARAAYKAAAAEIHAHGTLPSGDMLQKMIQSGITPIHRDTYHAHLGQGRYGLAALWYDLLSGRTVEGNAFRALDVPAEGLDFALVQRLAHETANDHRF